MYKRQHYALEHSGRNSASSDSSSLDTASDADSGGSEQNDDAAWPASSHESDQSSEEEVAEVESSASVVLRRAEAIRIAERKLAEAAEDEGEFGNELDRATKSGDETGGTNAERSVDSNGEPTARNAIAVCRILRNDAHIDGETSDVELNETPLAQRKVPAQWAEAVDEKELERKLDTFEGGTVICVGNANKVFKCRVCPKIVCLNEQTMQAHLVSKRHSMSMKQLADGKLKIQLDSDGEEEEDGETHAERYARTVAAAQELKEGKKRKSASGRQRQHIREKAKQKTLQRSDTGVPSVTGVNRKERRANLDRGLSEVNTGEVNSEIKHVTKRTEGKKLSRVSGESIRKKKRPKQT